jgi:transposase-like protein
MLKGELDAHLGYEKHSKTVEAVIKSVYLALRETSKKRTQPIRNWGCIINQFLIIFAQRLKI